MATTRKYARFRDSVSEYFECTNDKCKWMGKEEDKSQVPDPEYDFIDENVCPKCGNNEFYQITQEWAEKNIKLPVLTYNIEYSDGATRECIEIKKEQLPNIPEGKRMSLIYPNGQVYTGFFGGLDDQQIILKSISKNHTIGLPYAQLSQILVERY